MMKRVTLLLFAALASLQAGALAQDMAQDVQKHADAMMRRARELSDIRSSTAPAFRLKATFSFTGEDLEPVEGTFTELWISNSQWRKETVVNDLRKIEIGGKNRKWVSNDGDKLPKDAARVAALMDIFPPPFENFEFDTIRDHGPDDSATACAITKPAGLEKKMTAFCFEKQSGKLVVHISPEVFKSGAADYSCDYGSFAPFGSYTFPRELACFMASHTRLRLKVVELSADPAVDAKMFTPPTDAIELGNCSVKPQPPKVISQPLNPYQGIQDQRGIAILSLIVDIHGKPQDIQVTQSAGKSIDRTAVRSVQEWKFKPATCDGEVMAVQISIEINFNRPR
jgi:TonB family protein